MYQDYCRLAHSHGKFLIMHSDGYIDPIIPDLIAIGVDALNAQLDCMDVPSLAARFHGKIFLGRITGSVCSPGAPKRKSAPRYAESPHVFSNTPARVSSANASRTKASATRRSRGFTMNG